VALQRPHDNECDLANILLFALFQNHSARLFPGVHLHSFFSLRGSTTGTIASLISTATKYCNLARELSQNLPKWTDSRIRVSSKNKIGRLALVTGANRGLGFEICRQLVNRDITVILTSRNEEKGKQALERLKNLVPPDKASQLLFHQLDVTNDQSVANVVDYIKSNFKKCDILVNNAAIYLDGWNEKVFNDTINTNFRGVVRVTQAILPLMKEQKYGRIVNVTSGYGNLHYLSHIYRGKFHTKMKLKDLEAIKFDPKDVEFKSFDVPAYKLSKAMLNAYTKIVAEELAKDYPNIIVSAVDPGWVKTDMGGPEAPKSVESGAASIVECACLW
jgi:NAD(P)-dependent dehydrogenase (short-subunit alcohol dehydrogenase family)